MIWPWRRRKHKPVRFSELKWDVHSHIVPGVDDGAQDQWSVRLGVIRVIRLNF